MAGGQMPARREAHYRRVRRPKGSACTRQSGHQLTCGYSLPPAGTSLRLAYRMPRSSLGTFTGRPPRATEAYPATEMARLRTPSS